jgi:Holliday junction resolvase RusA-like endonuclease
VAEVTERLRASLEVPGRPVPKGPPRKSARGHWYTPKRTVDFENLIAWHVLSDTRVRFGTKEVKVRIEMWTHTPLRGDTDNYVKSILDGLQKGGLFDNDSQVGPIEVYPLSGWPKDDDHIAIVVEEL